MNTNSIYNLNDIPLFTYGMIGVATLGLALITMNIENDSFAKDDGYEKIKSKKSGGENEGSMFDVFSSKKAENEGSMFGSKSPENEGSMFDVFSSKKAENEGSMFGSKSPENQGSMFDVFSSKKPENEGSILSLKSGGKNNKTKHNKKHSVYTRKR